MAQQLLEAAISGDVEALESMHKDDPLILERVALLPFAETPLHVASLAGNGHFVEKIISLKPSFAQDLNQDGLSALHIASALGHIEIVRLLLTLSPDLCLLKDNDGRTSLHQAAIRGKAAVIEELLSKCPQALKELTAENDTALHLAVKNRQYEALRTLVERLGDDRELVNAKNKDDFSIFQLAKATGQLQVLDLLDGIGRGLQPGIPPRGRWRPPHKILFEMFKFAYDDQSRLIVAVLIATVTFQSFVTPPATLWKENMKLDYKCVFQGFSFKSNPFRYSKCPTWQFILFLFFNTTGFMSSCFLLILFKKGIMAQILISESIFSLFVCYWSLTGAMLPDSPSVILVMVALILVLVPVSIYISYIRVKFMASFIPRTQESS